MDSPHTKKSNLFRTLFALLLSLLFCSSVSAMENLVISAGPPRHGSGENADFFAALFAEIGERTNLLITVIHLPERRALDMAAHGASDGVAPRPDGLEIQYPQLVRVKEPLLVSRIVAFTRNGNRIDSWQDLAGKLAALPKGWSLPKQSLPASTRIIDVLATHHGMAMLEAGRVDATLTVLELGLHEITKHKLRHIDRNPPVLFERGLYLYLHERHAPLVPDIEKALKEAKADGDWYRIYKQAVEKFDARTK